MVGRLWALFVKIDDSRWLQAETLQLISQKYGKHKYLEVKKKLSSEKTK